MPGPAAIFLNGTLFFFRHALNAFAKLARMSQRIGASGCFTTPTLAANCHSVNPQPSSKRINDFLRLAVIFILVDQSLVVERLELFQPIGGAWLALISGGRWSG